MSVDGAKVTTTVSLEAVDGDDARCSFKVSVPLLRLPNAPRTSTQSGTLQFGGEMTVPLGEGQLRMARVQRQLVLDGDMTEDTASVHYQFNSDERRSTTPGGSFPDPESGEAGSP
jgi:hypothetical protein